MKYKVGDEVIVKGDYIDGTHGIVTECLDEWCGEKVNVYYVDINELRPVPFYEHHLIKATKLHKAIK